MDAPIDVKLTDAEKALIEALPQLFDLDFLKLVKRCSECNKFIIVSDNNIWLDAKPLPVDHDYPCPMGIMKAGSLRLACGGDIQGSSEHSLHDHQPEETS